MKLNQFMQENKVTEFEVLENSLVFSAIVNSTAYSLETDTSRVASGIKLTRTSDFSIDGDILTVAGITLNLAEVEIITPKERRALQDEILQASRPQSQA